MVTRMIYGFKETIKWLENTGVMKVVVNLLTKGGFKLILSRAKTAYCYELACSGWCSAAPSGGARALRIEESGSLKQNQELTFSPFSAKEMSETTSEPPLKIFTCELCGLNTPFTYYGQKPPNTRAIV